MPHHELYVQSLTQKSCVIATFSLWQAQSPSQCPSGTKPELPLAQRREAAAFKVLTETKEMAMMVIIFTFKLPRTQILVF